MNLYPCPSLEKLKVSSSFNNFWILFGVINWIVSPTKKTSTICYSNKKENCFSLLAGPSSYSLLSWKLRLILISRKCKNELNHIVPSFNVPSQFTVLEVATKTSLSMTSSSRFIFVALLSQSGNQNNIT